VFRQNPATQFVDVGRTFELVSFVEGMGEVAYQWQLYGTNIPGATSCVYTKTDFSEADAGPYTLVASNELGVATSAIGTVSVTPPPVLQTPTLLSQTEVIITWSSVNNRTYRVQSNTDVSTSNWLDVTDVNATASTASSTNDPAGATQLYYRVVLLPLP
jgi:hypothetical protein